MSMASLADLTGLTNPVAPRLASHPRDHRLTRDQMLQIVARGESVMLKDRTGNQFSIITSAAQVPDEAVLAVLYGDHEATQHAEADLKARIARMEEQVAALKAHQANIAAHDAAHPAAPLPDHDPVRAALGGMEMPVVDRPPAAPPAPASPPFEPAPFGAAAADAPADAPAKDVPRPGGKGK